MNSINLAREMFCGALDVLYPPFCLVCEADDRESFCLRCQLQISALLPPFCERCCLPVAGGRKLCPSCETSQARFDRVFVLGRYEGGLRRAIHLLKYEGKTALAKPLGKLISIAIKSQLESRASLPTAKDALANDLDSFDCVVPVPLHSSRQRERGFNQSLLIAKIIAENFNCELLPYGLQRVRKTRIQATLNQLERTGNVLGAFEIRSPLAFKNRRVLLVDDVMTTASTLKECARILKNGGASSVNVAVLARGD